MGGPLPDPAVAARRAADPDAKEGLQGIAQQWRELAEQVERRELEPTDA
jgi:hypothetical protein